MRLSRTISLSLGPAVAIALGLAAWHAGLPIPAAMTAAIAGLCAVYWVLEPIPIAATSLVPFAALPLSGVLDHADVARAYGHTMILLLLGGFMLSVALERSGAHRRLAVVMVRLAGGGSWRGFLLAVMVATAALSMWISNSATTLMMVPVVIAATDAASSRGARAPVLLGIAYAANIGGVGTPIGTPPNVIFMGAYGAIVGHEISFLDWMKVGVPCVVVMLPLAWWAVARGLPTTPPASLAKMGKMTPSEIRVLAVFAITALLWITRTEPHGGWPNGIGITGVGDSTIAILAVVVLFLVPNGEGEALLTWESASKIPWGLLILFGGGIALARAFEASGLAAAIAKGLAFVTHLPAWSMLVVLCLGVSFLTEITSNTATATLLMPVLAAAATAADVDPALLMAPAAISASCAFMLPVATAPNAIVVGSGHVSPPRMLRAGLWLNVTCALGVSAVCYWAFAPR